MLQRVKTKPKRFKDYRGIINDSLYREIIQLAQELKGLKVLQINATKYGGGVAEILAGQVPLMNDLGLNVQWEVIEGDNRLYDITKAFHNAFQGQEFNLTEKTKRTFERFNAYNAHILEGDWDIILIHDPQPATLPYYLCNEKAKYIWRCHIDTSHPDQKMWHYFEKFLGCYDSAIFTMPDFAPSELPINKVRYVAPAIDPLFPKNQEMSRAKAHKIMKKFGIDTNRLVVTQISRFDPWKDPIGVIDAYRAAKKLIPGLQLVLAGSMADDDPEGKIYLEKVEKYVGEDKDIHLFPDGKLFGNMEVSAFQQGSDVILQKSIREGFGLTVTEAMWKGKPVIAGNCGGIKLQITNGENGFLVETSEECAKRIVELIQNPDKAKKMGQKAKETARQNYLLPRLVRDELMIYKELLGKEKTKPKAKKLVKV